MPFVIIAIGFIILIVALATGRGFRFAKRAAEKAGLTPKRYRYTCSSCGTAVDTENNLGSKCDSCWGRDFESASERMDDL